MGCAGDRVCGVVCGGVWIGGVVYELGAAEGIYAICDLQDYFGGGGFVFCFADGMKRRGRVHTECTEVGTQRAQRRVEDGERDEDATFASWCGHCCGVGSDSYCCSRGRGWTR